MRLAMLTLFLVFASPQASPHNKKAIRSKEPHTPSRIAQIVTRLPTRRRRPAYGAPFQARGEYLWHDSYGANGLASNFTTDHA